VAISVAGTVTWSSVELTKVGVRKILGKLNPTFSIGFPVWGVKPVPFIVRVNGPLPATTEAGLRLVIVSGAVAVLKFAYTSDSSVGDKVSGLVVPVRSKVQPVNIHWPAGLVVVGVSVKVSCMPDG
jgi:hypothetical protein